MCTRAVGILGTMLEFSILHSICSFLILIPLSFTYIIHQMRIALDIRTPLLAITLCFSLCYYDKNRNQSGLQNHKKLPRLHEAHWDLGKKVLCLLDHLKGTGFLEKLVSTLSHLSQSSSRSVRLPLAEYPMISRSDTHKQDGSVNLQMRPSSPVRSISVWFPFQLFEVSWLWSSSQKVSS